MSDQLIQLLPTECYELYVVLSNGEKHILGYFATEAQASEAFVVLKNTFPLKNGYFQYRQIIMNNLVDVIFKLISIVDVKVEEKAIND